METCFSKLIKFRSTDRFKSLEALILRRILSLKFFRGMRTVLVKRKEKFSPLQQKE